MKKIKYSKLGLESFSLKELQRICRYYGIEYFPSWSKAKLREEILAYSPAETIKKTYTIPETYERLFMAGLLLLSTIVVGIFACTEWFPVNVVCDKPGLTGLFVAFVFAIMANQGTYPILPKVGANRQVSKNIILTTEFGRDTVVGMKELGTIADVQPDVPVG